MSRKLLIILIKYIPIIQMVGMLLNNTLYYFDIVSFGYFFDYFIGNSVITTFLILVCSYVFKYCYWHRLLIYSNFINITIAEIDSQFIIPINDVSLLSLYYIISAIFIAIARYSYVKHKDKYIA